MAVTKMNNFHKRQSSSSTSSSTTTTEQQSHPQILMETISINHDDGDDEDNENKDNNDKPTSTTPEATITKLTLNRPKAANAMGYEFVHTLQKYIQQLMSSTNTATRCMIITSYSTKVFSAGADLKERANLSLEETEEFVSLLRNTMDDLSTLPIPVIVAIEGVAVGGGLELALAGDIRIAGSNATLGLPETSLGIIPGAGGTQRLSRIVGMGRAKQLIWTGRKITAQEAYQYGLVDEVVLAGTATDAAVSLGIQIAKNAAPIAIQASKQAIMKGFECSTMKEALEVERQCYAKTLPTKDRLEGLAAFKEGRSPKYTGE